MQINGNFKNCLLLTTWFHLEQYTFEYIYLDTKSESEALPVVKPKQFNLKEKSKEEHLLQFYLYPDQLQTAT